MHEYRDASDRLTIDFDRIESSKYEAVTRAVVSRFDLKAAGPKSRGINEVFQVYEKEECVIGLEWDNWSGYIVNAKSPSGEKLAREIAQFIFDEFIR